MACHRLRRFAKRVKDRGYQDFQIGQLIRVDVNDYTKIDYQKLLEKLKQALKVEVES